MAVKKNTTDKSFSISKDNLEKMLKNLESTTVWISKKQIPELGETLIGLLTSIEHRKTQRGKKVIESDLAKIQTVDGIKSVYITSIMETRFEELNIEVGDIIGLKYNGFVKEAKNPYHNISVTKL
jgi:hypothetical protein